MLSKVLIIDKRKEPSVKYKKSLEDDNTSVVIARDKRQALDDIQSIEPDLILISDSIDEDIASFSERLRTLTYNIRPIIIALSKSAEANDRIKVLESGADDFISEPVNIDEFKSRIKAHLRRDIESNLDNKTLLPNKKIVERSLKRVIVENNHSAVLLVSVENLENYTSVYSDIAGDKLIQTFVAITKSTLEKDDFFGQMNDTTFVIITNRYRAEKLAAFLTFAFDTVAPKFYSESDAKRGYMLIKSDGLAGMRSNFVSLLIGGIVDNYELYNSVNSLLNRLFTIKKLAKIPSGSNYVIDRLKLSGENSIKEDKFSNAILIKEPDDALALLLRTTLELQGYDVVEECKKDESCQPKIMIIDSGDDLSELDFCRQIKENLNFVNTKIIVTTTIHDKIRVLDAGADLYLPKPYEISDLIRWVEYFIKQE